MPHYTPTAKERALYPIVDGVMIYPDGVELCVTDRAYLLRTEKLMVRQKGQCAICTRIMGYPIFDYEAGKGFGGWRQNDALYHPNGTWMNAALCLEDNTKKGSKRYAWQNGKYLPV